MNTKTAKKIVVAAAKKSGNKQKKPPVSVAKNEKKDAQKNGIRLLRKILDQQIETPEADMTIRQMSVLLHISLSDTPLTVRHLAAELDIHKPAITRAVDKLQINMNLVRRIPDPNDQRSVLIEMTAYGKKYVEKIAKNFTA